MIKKVLTKSGKETQKLAGVIVKNLLNRPYRIRASVVGLSGELGSGKTTLIQGIGKLLGIKEKIQSPTFVIMKKYRIARENLPWGNLIHIDAYRVEKRKEIFSLGLKNVFRNPKNLVAIEWPEKIKRLLPKQTLWIELKHKGGNHRHIVIHG